MAARGALLPPRGFLDFSASRHRDTEKDPRLGGSSAVRRCVGSVRSRQARKPQHTGIQCSANRSFSKARTGPVTDRGESVADYRISYT
jgi:hypothetical protein